MPSEFASAIADLRLSGDKLDQDFNALRGKLIRLTTQLEKQAAINIGVTVDVRKAQADLNRALSSFAARGGVTIPVGVNTDKALDDLAALQGLAQNNPLVVTVTAAVDAALDEIGALEGLALNNPIVVPVTAAVDAALDEIGALEGLALNNPLVVPVGANIDGALDEIGALEGLASNSPIVVPVGANVAPMSQAISSAVSNTLTQGQAGFGNAGDVSGRAFVDRFSQIASSALGTTSLALAGFLATSLVKGFQRLTTIQDATASLTVALGDATQAASVLDDVLAVVTGTPFNLDQFATAASNLISFGVEADKVPVLLTAIGEAAATRGSRANEFAQRLANTFGQVSVQGRLMGDDILSLQATGVDALSILGNSFGKTTVEIRKMISEGAVPADTALDLLAEGILNGSTGVNGATVAFAGTMAGLRQTLTGAIGGFSSATARFGAAVIKPFEEALTTGFNSATDVVNRFNKEVGKALGSVVDSEGFESFVEFIGDIPDQIDPLIERLSGLGPALAPLGAAFGALGLGRLSAAIGPLGQLVPAIGPLTAAVVAFVAATPELREKALPILKELGETAALLAAGLGDAFGKAIVEVSPLLLEFVDAIGDLSPTIATIAGATVGLAQGLVPVLGDLADLLDGFPVGVLVALGGAFLAFKAVSAAQAPIARLTEGITKYSKSLAAAEASTVRATSASGKFSEMSTRGAAAIGVTSERVTRGAKAMENSLNVAATAAAGFFSGMALGSEDATTQAIGFLGAATSIGTAFATTGPIGGIVTTAAVVGGALVDMWVDSKRAAEEYEKDVKELAASIIEEIGAATAALLDAQGLLADETFRDGALKLIGEDQLLALEEAGVAIGDVLALATDRGAIEGVIDQIDGAYAAADAAAQARVDALFLAGDTLAGQKFGQIYGEELVAALNVVFASQAGTIDLSGLVTPVTDGFGVTTVETEGLDKAVDLLGELNVLYGSTETALDRANVLLTQNNKLAFDTIQTESKLTDQQLSSIQARAALLGISTEDLIKNLEETAPLLDRLLATAFPDEVDINPFDLAAIGLEEFEKQFGFTIEEAEDGSLKFVNATGDMEDGMDATALASTAMADAIEAAMKEADEAASRFTGTLDTMLGKLDQITARQDYAAGFRDIGEALNEITNSDELQEAERLIEDIGKQRDDIASSLEKMADEQVKANRTASELEASIEQAEEAGAVQGAAALRAQRDRVFSEVDKIGREIAEKQEQTAQLEADLAKLSQVPVTLAELLGGQASERGISLAELLIAAPTSESREFFQSEIANQINEAGGQIQQAVDDNPLDAALEIPSIVDGLVRGFIGSGLDEVTARALVDSILDPTKLANAAVDSFEAAFNADVAKLGGFTEAILAGEDIDPLKVEAVVVDVGEGIAALEERERLGLTIPGDVDLVAARDSLATFENAYSASDFKITIPIDGDLTGIIADLESLAAFALQLNGPDGLGPSFGTSADRGQQWWERSFTNTRSTVGRGGINSPRRLEHGGILRFFKDGGITENHVAQISRNTARIWSEPETGGEGYIPLHPSKRPRSTRILTDIADIFGLDVMPRGVGNGMDESSMARAVERGVKAGRTPSPAARARAHDSAARSVNVEKIEVNGVKNPNTAARRVIRRLSDVAMGMNDWDEDWD